VVDTGGLEEAGLGSLEGKMLQQTKAVNPKTCNSDTQHN
jgi:hypothetical protein